MREKDITGGKSKEDMDLGMETRFLKIKAQIKLKRDWHLNPPIPQTDVGAIENAYGFVLPEEYKKFITQIGNGGDIPSLHDDDPCRFIPFGDTLELKDVGYDFPLSESWEWDTDLNFSMDDPKDAEKWEQVQKNGIVALAKEDVGGGQAYFLVVSGERKGEVWERDESGILRLPGCTFLDWVELYLSKQLIPYTDKLFRQEKSQKEAGDSLSEIRALMAAKRRQDIRWNPPVPVDAVKDFEQQHGIILPEQYVTFITEIADGCENFPSANSNGKGGIFYSLAQLDCLPNLDKAFYFTKNTEETRKKLTNSFGPDAFTRKNPVWEVLFADIPRENPLNSIWAYGEYSVLQGALPFAYYNDEKLFRTQPILIVTGPLKGQVWRATSFKLRPDGDSFYQWVIKMLKGDAR